MSMEQVELELGNGKKEEAGQAAPLEDQLAPFSGFGKQTVVTETEEEGFPAVPTFVNEFWTAKQRAGHSLHEISYRACFKPQLPRFFIERLTGPGDVVYDPFSGRGTTGLEAALLGRTPYACDVNPLARVLLEPRLSPPAEAEVEERLRVIPWQAKGEIPEELLVFYHPETLREIVALRAYFRRRSEAGELDRVDKWIRMVAVNRLTGHSAGFFSVYTLPPNQAVSIKSQKRINEKRNQTPQRRDVPKLIGRKTRQLMRTLTAGAREELERAEAGALLLTGSSGETPEIEDESIDLVVTSPPFLDVVDYSGDNWLRWWFCDIRKEDVRLDLSRKLEKWEETMTAVFRELGRVLAPRGHVAFEVGEVNAGKVQLERSVVRCGSAAGLAPRLILINDQKFTKTAHCWGVSNSVKGTNTNRIVLFQKAPPAAGG